jgi:prepilin-type processing-associated H-X9-DG protein
VDDKDNRKVAAIVVRVFVDPMDPVTQVDKDLAPTNYLFSAGARVDLKDNNGVFFRDSKIRIADVAAADGASNTIMIGQTLKGDGGTKATDLHRQMVRLKREELKNLKNESGVQDFKDDKNIVGDRCRSWMDGRFLQGTFTGTRTLNDDKPDVDCDGAGGLSGLRGLKDGNNVAFCDGSVRFLTSKIKLDVWKALVGRDDGIPLPEDF